MTKKLLVFSFLILGVVVWAGYAQNNQTEPSINLANQTTDNSDLMPKVKQSAEKIEVVHFHATQQCWSCITVGEYALKTIKEKFPEEYKNGTIMFKDINGELPINKDMVMKYEARGSSLFINAINGEEDNIEEDIKVWRLVTNEDQFIDYFENKLKTLLGK